MRDTCHAYDVPLTDQLRDLVEHGGGAVGYGVLAGSALIEYVFPPFPGDFVTVLGAVLVTGYGWSFFGVLGAVMAGSIAGSLLAHQLGLAWARRRERTQKKRPMIDALVARFQRRGPAYLIVNRFLPGVRALFFVAAGLAGVRRRDVMLYAGISALLWNLALMGLGAAVGANLDDLIEIVERYTAIAWIAVAVIAVIVIAKLRRAPPSDP
jgi:membrane protein DedA with SNARE-associated domain